MSAAPSTQALVPPAAPAGPAGPAGRALAAALAAHHFSHPTVAAALATFVRQARDAGAPPERVLVGLKAVLRPFDEADRGGARAEGAAAGGLRERLVADAVRTYYRTD
jgi:alkanesulfonate monooxygenase SsuD/methylene tetrahydromethanopterin reductase-like flavin-dependent oxidoreductase (luciferase family)